MYDKKYLLADYFGRRVTVVGWFDKLGNRKKSEGGWIHWALFQDLWVEEDCTQLGIGHAHIQFAVSLNRHDLRRGDRVSMTCLVGSYKKRLPLGNMQDTYNLSYPEDIEVIERAPRPPVATLTLSDCEDLLKVKKCAQSVGGLDRLVVLTNTLLHPPV